jgi:hypothetical protein
MTETTFNRLGLAQEVLTASEGMIAACDAGEFDCLAELQAKREALIIKLFVDVAPSDVETSDFVNIISQIQLLNDRLVVLALHKRDSLGAELSSLNSARKARSAYSEYLL